MLEEKTVLGDENYSVIREGLLTWDEETKRRLRGYSVTSLTAALHDIPTLRLTVSIPSGCDVTSCSPS